MYIKLHNCIQTALEFHTYWVGKNCSNQAKCYYGNLHSVMTAKIMIMIKIIVIITTTTTTMLLLRVLLLITIILMITITITTHFTNRLN